MKARKIRLIVTSVLGGAVILALIAATAFILISHARGEIPFFGGRSVMWITTGSMEPLIPERSYILFEKVEAQDVSLGDVIVFVSDDPEIEGQYNTHRVVGINGNNESFVTRGDNAKTNKVNDAYPARAEKLVGRFVRVLPFLSVMGRMLSSTVGLFAVGVLIVALLMLMYLPDMARVIKAAEKAKKDKEALMNELVEREVARLKAQNQETPRADDPGSGISEPKADPPDAPRAQEEPKRLPVARRVKRVNLSRAQKNRVRQGSAGAQKRLSGRARRQ